MVRRIDKKPSIIGTRSNEREHLPDSVHPLVIAAHLAHSQEVGMTLSPRVAWCTIMQGLAQHVLCRNTDTKRNERDDAEIIDVNRETQQECKGLHWKASILNHLKQASSPPIKRLAALYEKENNEDDDDISRLCTGFVAYRPFSLPSNRKRHFTPDCPLNNEDSTNFVNVLGDAQEWDTLSRTTFLALSDFGPDPVADAWKRKLVPTLATVATFQRRKQEAQAQVHTASDITGCMDTDCEIAEFWKSMYRYIYACSDEDDYEGNTTTPSHVSTNVEPQPFCSESSSFVSNADHQPLISAHSPEDPIFGRSLAAAIPRVSPKFSGWLTHFFPYTRDGRATMITESENNEKDVAISHEDLHPGYTSRFFVERDVISSGKAKDVYAAGGTVGITVTFDEESGQALYEPTLGWVCGNVAQPREIPSDKLGSMFIHDTDKIRNVTHDFFEELVREGVYGDESKNGYPQFLTRLNQALGTKHGLPKNSVSVQSFKEAKRDFDVNVRGKTTNT